MTSFMTAEEADAADEFLAAQFHSAAEESETRAAHGHTWRPTAYGRLECFRCSLAPHTPALGDAR